MLFLPIILAVPLQNLRCGGIIFIQEVYKMINGRYARLGKVRSVIRELFEYGNARKAQIGEDKVFDFSLGNPSVPPPEELNAAIADLIANTDAVTLHGYTSAQGAYDVRKSVTDYITKTFGATVDPDCIYMTCGAAAAITITLCALCNAGDEVITFVPYFPEYAVFSAQAGAKLVPVKTAEDTFSLDFGALRAALTDKTKAVIINSPNNPAGIVYSAEEIQKLCDILAEHSRKIGQSVYLISDEPYRELVYDGVEVPYVMNFYKNSIVCYSFSKSLSVPGERIGYIAVNGLAQDREDIYAAVCGAGRSLGYVCAPSLLQRLAARLIGKTSDISAYKANRDRLCSALESFGFSVVKPQGAFYLFVKSPEADANAFAERAKKYELLLVPGDDFGCKGYVRIAYCVSADMIERSLPAFRALAESYKNG